MNEEEEMTAPPKSGMQSERPTDDRIEARTTHWYEITVCKADIGCKTFVFTTWEEASQGFSEYWLEPVAAERKYCRKET